MLGLEEIEAGSNQLMELTAAIGALPNLTNLYLEDNYLKTLPEEIGTCVQ